MWIFLFYSYIHNTIHYGKIFRITYRYYCCMHIQCCRLVLFYKNCPLEKPEGVFSCEKKNAIKQFFCHQRKWLETLVSYINSSNAQSFQH